jgi:hypothetical protein
MKKIKFYSDVREMEIERIREISDMSPVIRIKNTVELIRRIYPIRTIVSGKKKINIKG